MTLFWPDWSGETVVIVASGPSASKEGLTQLVGKACFLAINESWRLCPWADVLYACDGDWWRHHAGLPQFERLRLTQEKRAADEFGLGLVNLVKGFNRMMEGPVGSIGDGGNSGFQALNLAIQFGAARVLLVGFDMRIDRGEHWHGRHPAGLNNPRANNVQRWLNADWSVPAGVEVINCNPESALDAYPKMSFEDACSLC